MPDSIEISVSVDDHNAERKASELLSAHANLPQSKIKDAMCKGAVWLHRDKRKQRLRRSSKTLKVGDKLELHYNPEILDQVVPEPQLIHDGKDYSVWFKPFGLSCQGSRWGDFATINRWVELSFHKIVDSHERPVFLVHRLDRATTGLMLLCHGKAAAQTFSRMFREGKIDKRYQAIVHGDFSHLPSRYEVNLKLDGKACRSIFSHVAYQEGCSLVDVELHTGRKHQIRKHLSALGYAIVGDRLYGDVGEEGSRDLQLQSVSLAFECPFTHQKRQFTVPETRRLVL